MTSASSEDEETASSTCAIVGLGNPGETYDRTRHNIGFLVIDAWMKRLQLNLTPVCREFQAAVGSVRQHTVIFMKPMTYMNRSGSAVVEACRRYDLTPEHLIVICDDVNLPFGTLRLRGRGSYGGNNGLGSIINSLGTVDFARQRIGVGSPEADVDLEDYVLEPFTEEEKAAVPSIIDRAYEQLNIFVEEDWMMAASRYNGQ